MLKLLDVASLLPIRVMHGPSSIVPSALGRDKVFQRMKLKLLDLTNWLPIRMSKDTAAAPSIPPETLMPLLTEHCLDPRAARILERNENF
jgi:hypothetical protein